MSLSPTGTHWKAIQMLLLANLFWGLSFPTMKALATAQQMALPQGNTWFFAALSITYRFGIAAAVMGFLCRHSITNLTRSEFAQGLGLGLFAAGGLMLQMDGLSHTAASTSAFLTQCYSVIIPGWVAIQERRLPSKLTLISCGLVMAGVAILSGLNLNTLSFGRGEIETMLASLLFTGQILWLQRPCFLKNKVGNFSFVMFLVIALACAPVAWISSSRGSDIFLAYASKPAATMLCILVVFCTLGSYLLMNRWQPLLTATQAGLIYCVEPLFASLFALFLPGWFSVMAAMDYSNETVTRALLLGGGLITGANALIQFEPTPHPPTPPQSTGT